MAILACFGLGYHHTKPGDCVCIGLKTSFETGQLEKAEFIQHNVRGAEPPRLFAIGKLQEKATKLNIQSRRQGENERPLYENFDLKTINQFSFFMKREIHKNFKT